jgi:hypothetical protein
MKSRLERAIEAYRDGALSPRRRRKIEGILERDGDAQRHLEEGRALGRLIRQAWNEGPPSPPPERFLAAIRADLQRIDAERARSRRSRRLVLRPVWLRPLPYLACAAAAALVIALGDVHQPSWAPGAEQLAMEPREDNPDLDFMNVLASGSDRDDDWASSGAAIYDIYQGDAGLFIYDGQDESPVLIFAIPDEYEDEYEDEDRGSDGDLSVIPVSLGDWS